MPETAPLALTSTSHNVNALILGTVEFSFAETPFVADAATMLAAARLAGFRDFGNMVAFSMTPEVTKKEHKGSYRGVLRVDSTKITDTKLSYKLTCDEFTYQAVQLMLCGAAGAKVSQAAVTYANKTTADSLAFTAGTPGKMGVWYDITVSTVRIHKITNIVVTPTAGSAWVDGTDYVVDAEGGRIMFKPTGGAGGTTANLITTPITITLTDLSYSAYTSYSTAPMATTKRVGVGRMVMFDDVSATPVPMEHVDFGCEITPEGATDFGGEDFGKYSLNVLMTLPIGTLRVREVAAGTVVA